MAQLIPIGAQVYFGNDEVGTIESITVRRTAVYYEVVCWVDGPTRLEFHLEAHEMYDPRSTCAAVREVSVEDLQ